jgi:hypothetical protein
MDPGGDPYPSRLSYRPGIGTSTAPTPEQGRPRTAARDTQFARSTTRPGRARLPSHKKAPAPLQSAQREAVASGDEMLVGEAWEVSAGAAGDQRYRIVTELQRPWIERLALLGLATQACHSA